MTPTDNLEPITEEELSFLLDLLKRITPGQWRAFLSDDARDHELYSENWRVARFDGYYTTGYIPKDEARANIEFVGLVRNLLPRLLKGYRKLKEENENFRKRCKGLEIHEAINVILKGEIAGNERVIEAFDKVILKNLWYSLKARLPVGEPQKILGEEIDRARQCLEEVRSSGNSGEVKK